MNDRFKEEELLKIVGDPQNIIQKVKKIVIRKLVKPVINNNKEYYEVQWKGYNETTLEQRDIMLEDVPKLEPIWEEKLNSILW